jgi:thioredoxin-related protein
MDPIVHGVVEQYESCLTLVRVNFHTRTPLRDKLSPFSTPEFALLDPSGRILYRWLGYTERERFDAVLDPLCQG